MGNLKLRYERKEIIRKAYDSHLWLHCGEDVTKEVCVERFRPDAEYHVENISSRFTIDEEEVIDLVKACIEHYIPMLNAKYHAAGDVVVKGKLSLSMKLDHVIGDGWAQHTDYSNRYQFSTLRVVIRVNETNTNFDIVTAYPTYGKTDTEIIDSIEADRRDW